MQYTYDLQYFEAQFYILLSNYDIKFYKIIFLFSSIINSFNCNGMYNMCFIRCIMIYYLCGLKVENIVNPTVMPNQPMYCKQSIFFFFYKPAQQVAKDPTLHANVNHTQGVKLASGPTKILPRKTHFKRVAQRREATASLFFCQSVLYVACNFLYSNIALQRIIVYVLLLKIRTIFVCYGKTQAQSH